MSLDPSLHQTTLVRQAREGDLEGVLALYRELRPDDPVLSPQRAHDSFANLIQTQNVALIVCDSDGVLTATCMLAVIPNLTTGARPFGVIEHVVTLAQFRRRGHARLVLRYALDLAWSRHCYKVMLLSGVQRKQAHGLYESVGFVAGIEAGFVAKPP